MTSYLIVHSQSVKEPGNLWVSRTGSASDWCALQEALYKFIDTIQYNTTLWYVVAHWLSQ